MDASAFVIFGLVLLVAAGSPGPSIAALVARVIARGWRDVAPFVAAMWIGEAVWLALAVAGLAALAESFHYAFLTIKYAGVAYLVYLAWQMWRAPAEIAADAPALTVGGAAKMFLAGLAVTLGNPKIMVFYMALLPTILDLEAVAAGDFAALIVTMLVVLAIVDGAYVALAARARLLMKSPRVVRLANRLSATVMAGAAAAIATR